MNQCLIVLGLFFNLIGTAILAYPLLKSKKDIDKDLITDIDKKKGVFETKGSKKDKYIALVGLSFLGSGFILQIIGYI